MKIGIIDIETTGFLQNGGVSMTSVSDYNEEHIFIMPKQID